MPLQLFLMDFCCSLFSKIKCLVTLNLSLGIFFFFFFLSDNISVFFFFSCLLFSDRLRLTRSHRNGTKNSHGLFTQLSSMIISYKNILQCQNQEIDIGTIILTQIQALFRFQQLVYALFFFSLYWESLSYLNL